MKAYSIILTIVLSVFLSIPVQAQKQRGRKNIIVQKTNDESNHNTLFMTMLPATAKVMFIDSVKVPLTQFMQVVAGLPNMGTFGTQKTKGKRGMQLASFTNQMDDRRIATVGDSTETALLDMSAIGNGWDKGRKLVEIDSNEFLYPNYPFLMSDGVTLYFSAEGKNSVGGRDIFMTTYDSENNKFFQPQNVGLPFNSVANEYLMAIDDEDTLGWIVSDRYQTADTVCIYTFVPTATRTDYQADNLSKKELLSRAELRSIKDTWSIGDRKKAKLRLDEIRKNNDQTNNLYPPFIINDNKVIYSARQLTGAGSGQLYEQWLDVIQNIEQTNAELMQMRQSATQNKSYNLKHAIVEEEAKLLQLHESKKALEKKIRQNENQ